jgi:hypothetical protein
MDESAFRKARCAWLDFVSKLFGCKEMLPMLRQNQVRKKLSSERTSLELEIGTTWHR